MNLIKRTNILEIAIHIIIILIGIVVLFVAREFGEDAFMQSLLINIGSSLVVVTILFFIFEGFRRRHESQEIENADSKSILPNKPSTDSRTSELMKSVRERQQRSVVSGKSKVNHDK